MTWLKQLVASLPPLSLGFKTTLCVILWWIKWHWTGLFLSTLVIYRQYYFTKAPYSFIHLSPVLYNLKN